jgi:hypothetical protein
MAQQKKCREPDGGSGIASNGLRDNMLRRKLRKLAHDSCPQIVVGNDPKIAWRGHRCEACHGLLDHGVLAIQREQLLGATLAAKRPEARAAASGKNYGIEVRVRFHYLESLPLARGHEKSCETS